MTTQQLSPKAKRAITKYGKDVCMEAFRMNNRGEGARTISFEFKMSTNQADAAIDAGRELTAQGNTMKIELYGVALPTDEVRNRLLAKAEMIKISDNQSRSSELILEAFGYVEALNDLGHLSAEDVIRLGQAFKSQMDSM